MTNKEIAKQFRTLAALLDLHGENAFKIRSYENAAISISRLEGILAEMTDAQITAVSGIGSAVAQKIRVLLQTGTFPLMDELLAKTPPGVVKMLDIKGIGAKKVRIFWQDLGIENPGELLYACEENRLASLNGIGAKTQENIKQQILYALSGEGKHLWADIEAEVLKIKTDLMQQNGIIKAEIGGTMRRLDPIIEEISLVVAVEPDCNAEVVCKAIGLIIKNIQNNNWEVTTESGLNIALYTCSSRQFTSKLFLCTASSQHIKDSNIEPDKIVEANSEVDIYAQFGLPFVPPELRDNITQLEWAIHNDVEQLIQTQHIKGILHAHSTYSDGANTLRDMAIACKNAGYEYLGISDHSVSAFYAGGLKPERIIEQHLEIEELNRQLAPFKVFKGIEADILGDGRLDYNTDILASFDFVIASIHANLFMDEAKATARLIKAIENPFTTILGHLTGRLLLTRQGYPVNHLKIIDACAANNVIIELNANPRRLDIDYLNLQYCMKKGVKIAINPDAHNIAGLNHIRYGVNVARKGLLTHNFVLNTLRAGEIEQYFKQKQTQNTTKPLKTQTPNLFENI